MGKKRLSLLILAVLITSLLGYLVTSNPQIAGVSDPVHGLWGSIPSSKHPSGTLRLEGLDSEVVVVWDKWGVPYIFAETERDLYYAFGFVQGLDRMFQMDLTRRVAEGRLSELLGEPAYDIDEFFRIVGLHRAAQETLSTMMGDKELRKYYEVLEAYSEGVNAYIEWAKAHNMLPPEYRLLGAEPEPWKPLDSLAVGKLIAWGLAGSFSDVELKAFLDANGYEALFELGLLERPLNTAILGDVDDAVYPRGTWLNTTGSGSAQLSISRDYLEWLERIEEFVGSLVGEAASNNWVVSGKLTETGYPIVANDPHLSLQAPPTWYEACLVLRGRGWVVRGVTFPGLPVIVIGRNNNVAWGFTNVGADVTDFYYYKWRDGKYLYQGQWLEPQTIVEEIRIKTGSGYRVVKLRVNVTIHGPLVEKYGERYALRWTGLQPTYEFIALYLMNYATSIHDYMRAQKYFMVPAQNAVYADTEGNIAYYPAGLYPIRGNLPVVEAGSLEVPNYGFLPFNGSSGEGEWVGYIPFDEIPHVVNPERGFIATANNAPVSAKSYKYYLGWHWADRFRHDRIVQMIQETLESKGKISVEDVMRMQTDYKSLAAETLVPLLLQALDTVPGSLSDAERQVAEMLRNWDYVMRPDAPEPAIYTYWLKEFYDRLWEDEYEAAGIKGTFLPLETAELVLRGELDEPGRFSKWVDKPLGELVLEALRSAMDKLAKDMGTEDPAKWRWGNVHIYAFNHPLGEVLPWLNYPRYPAPGGFFTVNVAPGLKVGSGPSIRYIADMRPGKTGYLTLPGGNSGHPFSIHYYDQLDMWVKGGYKPLLMPSSPEQVEATETLRLVPGGG